MFCARNIVSLEDGPNLSIFLEVDPLNHPPDNDMGSNHGHDITLHEQGHVDDLTDFQLSF